MGEYVSGYTDELGGECQSQSGKQEHNTVQERVAV